MRRRDETGSALAVGVSWEATVTDEGTTQVTDRFCRDWSDLGAMVARVARRATAMHLVESAAMASGDAGFEWVDAAGIGLGDVRNSARTDVLDDRNSARTDVLAARSSARTAEGDRAGSLKGGSFGDGGA